MKYGRAMRLTIILSLFAISAWQIAQAGWIHGKAVVAQYMLENAWQQTVRGGTGVKPWPWADTWPVARLTIPVLGIDQIVLAGDSGRTLAFGPGYSFSSAWPGNPGSTLISGHRDTHFRFLKDLNKGDVIRLQTSTSDLQYVVSDTAIVDARKFRIYSKVDGTKLLVLATCYPFNAIRTGGELRFLVEAQLI
jgi:sortase A